MHTVKPGVLKDMHKQLKKYAILFKQDIGVWEYTRGMFLGDSYEMEDFKSEIKSGDIWYAAYDSAHFFKASVTVPEEMDGKELRCKFQVGGEALVKCNGVYVSGCTSRDSLPDRTEVALGIHKAGEVLTFEVEATVDSMSFCDPAMDGATHQECRFGATYIYVADEDCEGYYLDIDVAFEALEYIKDEHVKAKVMPPLTTVCTLLIMTSAKTKSGNQSQKQESFILKKSPLSTGLPKARLCLRVTAILTLRGSGEFRRAFARAQEHSLTLPLLWTFSLK